MVVRLEIVAPATITVLAGGVGVSSLNQVPPTLGLESANAGGTITVLLVADNAGAALSAASAGGATIAGSGNTLSISGDLAAVNAALATLDISEPGTATSDLIAITADQAGALAATTDVAVDVAPDTGPAFANPPASVTLKPGAVDALPGLVIGDPQAGALTAAGQGMQETMAVTLAAASGILLLPGFSGLDGIGATGLATGTIVLTFTADRLGAVNALLAGLEFAGPAASSGLAYSLRDVAGPLPTTVTAGNIALDITGAAGAAGTFAAGTQSLIEGAQTIAAGHTVTIAGDAGDLGGIAGAGAVVIAADAALNLPYNTLALGGTSLDFGTLAAVGLDEAGNLFIAESATFAAALDFGAGALGDFAGNLIAGNSDVVTNELDISLSTGALLIGDGTIIAGNFSEAGRISGPGTILAEPGETILINAGSIGGGANLDVAAGGVMILGPVSPLYGVFNPTPLTIDSSVTLGFSGTGGLAPITGGFADALDQSGGVFVITGPQVFSGTVTGFLPGDRLIFPGLTGVSPLDISATSFIVAGESNGNTVEYQIFATIPAGDTLYATIDSAGDPEVGLRPTTVQVELGGSQIGLAEIATSANIAQPIQGLALLLTAATSLTLTVTLSVQHGVLTDGALIPGSALTITAANVTALNTALAGLTYTGTGHADILTLSSGTGVLAGLDATAQIVVVPAGADAGSGSAGQYQVFATPDPTPVTGPAALGSVSVSADTVFDDDLNLAGIAGSALVIDTGAAVIFDAGASVAIAADVTIGDRNGAGTLAVITDDVSIGAGGSANLTIGGIAGAGGSGADIFGMLDMTGDLIIGTSATAALDLAGSLGAAATDLGGGGTLFGYGSAAASLGAVQDSGTIGFTDQADITASAISLSGLLTLGGMASLADAGSLAIVGGQLLVGPDAALTAATLSLASGAAQVAGRVSAGAVLIQGGTASLNGGTIAAPSFTIGTGGTLTGNGILSSPGTILTQGFVTAAGGALLFGADVDNTGTIAIAAGATLDAAEALNGTVMVSGTAAELIINDVAVFTGTIGNFAATDVIDLVGIAPSLVSDSGGSIVVGSGSTALATFGLSTAGVQPAISILPDGAGGALITADGDMPCFARGTRLLTPNGYRPVEALNPGDALITAGGDRRAIFWIGRRTLDFGTTRARPALPVLIMPGALGNGKPLRPLRLSPLHAVFLDGVLVPAVHLVNGATILRQTAPAAITYYHVELARHDIVLAEGVPSETYLDTGNRGPLYAERGTRAPAGRPYAPRVTGGQKLAAIRWRLHRIALDAGFTLTYQPVLRAVAADRASLPEIRAAGRRRLARFALPEAPGRVTLLSRCASPADTDPDSEDRRDLALCLAAARAGQRAATLGPGWLPRAAADSGTWMGTQADLLLPPGATTLTLSLAAIIRTWRPPNEMARAAP